MANFKQQNINIGTHKFPESYYYYIVFCHLKGRFEKDLVRATKIVMKCDEIYVSSC